MPKILLLHHYETNFNSGTLRELRSAFGLNVMFEPIFPKTQDELRTLCEPLDVVAIHILDKEHVKFVPDAKTLKRFPFVMMQYPGPVLTQVLEITFKQTTQIRKRFPVSA